MIRLELGGDGTQNITKVCNMCGCHIEDLPDDILVKPPNNDLTIKDSQGNEVTRTKLPTELTECKCEMCND
jgi:hypothetical protein